MSGPKTVFGRHWRWQRFGENLSLVTDGGGAQVVIGAFLGTIRVRDAMGFLVPITEGHPVAKQIAATPQMVELLQALIKARTPYDHSEITGRAEVLLRDLGIEP